MSRVTKSREITIMSLNKFSLFLEKAELESSAPEEPIAESRGITVESKKAKKVEDTNFRLEIISKYFKEISSLG